MKQLREWMQVPVRLRTGKASNRSHRDTADLDLIVRMYKKHLERMGWYDPKTGTQAFFKTSINLKAGYIDLIRIDTTKGGGFLGTLWKPSLGDHVVSPDDSKDHSSQSCQLRVYAGGDHWQPLPTTGSYAKYLPGTDTLRVYIPTSVVIPVLAGQQREMA